MAEKVEKVGIKKETGYLYFVDKKGGISRAKMARKGRKKGSTGMQKVADVNITKHPGYLYFVDRAGDISRAKMARGRK